MPYDAPGQRVEVVFPGQGEEGKDAIPTNSFAVVDNKVLKLTKTGQIGRYVDPTSPEATEIQPNELCVGFLGGIHELPLEGPLAGVARPDKLWINAATNEIVLDPNEVGVNEVQKVKVDGTGATYRLEVDGELTDKLAPGLTAAQLKAELEELDNIDPGDVAVTGGPGDAGGTTPYSITFAGQYEDENVPTIEVVEEELTGGGAAVTVTTTTAGAAGDEILPLGVVDEVDPTRTPDVARVNCNALNAFMAA